MFNSRIVGTVCRVGARYAKFRPDVRDDIVQELYLKLAADQARVLRKFEPWHPGSAFGYVQRVAMRVAQDYLKSKKHAPHTDQTLDGLEIVSLSRTEWQALMREIDDWLRHNVSERDRQIFWLYYRQGMSARDIAALPAYQLKEAGVVTVICSTSKLVRAVFGNGGRR